MKPTWLDLETTGTKPDHDRIIEIGIDDPETGQQFSSLVNPAMWIPKEASEVHHIYNTDVDRDAAVAAGIMHARSVEQSPLFLTLAKQVHGMVAGRDLAGYSIRTFDRPLLVTELLRCGQVNPWPAEPLIYDVVEVVRKADPQTLENVAKRHLTTLPVGNAHSAIFDVKLAQEVLRAFLERYPEIPRGGEALAMWGAPEDVRARVDPDGRLIKDAEGFIVMNFGDHAGKRLVDLVKVDDGKRFLNWVLGKDFSDRVKIEIRKALGITDPRQRTLL